jgi:hypothetical protein
MFNTVKSGDTSLGIAMGYGLECRRSIPGKGVVISLLHSVHIESGAQPASYTVRTGGSFAAYKVAGE